MSSNISKETHNKKEGAISLKTISSGMGTVTSDRVMVKRGCPRGNTFEPLLWNIYQIDIPNIMSKANAAMNSGVQ